MFTDTKNNPGRHNTQDLKLVLPETLVLSILLESKKLVDRVASDQDKVLIEREHLRKMLQEEKLLHQAQFRDDVTHPIYAIDGGCGSELDMANTYLSAVAVKIGQDQTQNASLNIHDVAPHTSEIESVLLGIMTVMEILLARQAQRNNNSWILIDGSRIAGIKQIQRLYAFITTSQGRAWLQESSAVKKLLDDFESDPNVFHYLIDSQMVGLTKMVSTKELFTRLSKIKVLPGWMAHFDDKALASVILRTGEFIGPLYLTLPLVTSDSVAGYPHAKAVNLIINSIHEEQNPCQLAYVYFKPRPDVTLKIEVNRSFLGAGALDELLTYLHNDIQSTEFMDPYQMWLADRMCKEAVRMSFSGIKTLLAVTRNAENWNLNSPHRTPKL